MKGLSLLENLPAAPGNVIDENEDVYGHLKRLRFIQSSIDDYSAKTGVTSPRVLDVGCGTGIMTSLPLAVKGYSVVGVDLDADSIVYATELGKGLPNARFICADVRTFPLEDTYDIAICSEVLEHLDDPKSLLVAIKSRVVPDGIIIITVPNGYGWFELEQFIWKLLCMDAVYSFTLRMIEFIKVKMLHRIGFAHRYSGVGKPVPASLSQTPHIQRFTVRSMRRLFKECGLHLISEGRASLFSGRFTHVALGRWRRFIRVNAKITDFLPPSLASGWYFALQDATNDSNARGIGVTSANAAVDNHEVV